MSDNTKQLAKYSHLITTRPHDITRVVISDLHLSADEPALVQAFLALLNDLIALPSLTELYILGDWFDAWIGDDAYLSLSDSEKQSHWLTPLINQLTQLTATGCQTFVMHGNRDFLIGQSFCDTFGGQLISEPYMIQTGDCTFRLEHGDALCTDDKAYQRFRRIMRQPIVQWLILKRSLDKRLALAKRIRQQSARGKSTKSMTIMDVNQKAVQNVLQQADCLLHGHTHRPAIHPVRLTSQHPAKDQNKTLNTEQNSDTLTKIRYVLGDWRVLDRSGSPEQVEAVIGIFTQTSASLLAIDSSVIDSSVIDSSVIDSSMANNSDNYCENNLLQKTHSQNDYSQNEYSQSTYSKSLLDNTMTENFQFVIFKFPV